MSYTENLRTVEEFTENGWRQTPHSRRVEEIISVHNESSRFTDRFTYFYDENGFYMWAKDKPEDEPRKIHVKNIIDRSFYPGSAEGEVLDKLDGWFSENSEGLVLWVSPSYQGIYRDAKIILHQITYTPGDIEKALASSSDVFKATDEEVLGIIQEFFPETKKIADIEAIRSILITPDANFDPQRLQVRIKEIDPDAINLNGSLEEEQVFANATYVSNLIGSGKDARFVAQETKRLGLLGRHPLTCLRGLSFSELVGGRLMQDQHGSLEFKCPTCNLTNRRPSGVLISNCQHCGANVRC